MTRLISVWGITALGLLTACNDNPAANVTTVVETHQDSVTKTTTAAPGPQTLADTGFGKTSFATARDIALAQVQAALGPSVAQGSSPECSAGPLDHADFQGGLSLFFQGGKFVGWAVDGRNGSPYRTATGIGIGSTLKQLRDTGDVAVQDTPLGVEFKAGEISGLATVNNADGKVTSLWAGATCALG